MRTNRPESRTVTEQVTAVQRATLSQDQLAEWFPKAFGDVACYLYHHGIAPNGFPFARHHVRLDGRFEVEAGFPVATPITGNGPVEPSILPGGPVLVVWHVGPYAELGTAYQAMADWLEAEGATRTGDAWEIYHDPPTSDPMHWRTEVVQPFTLAGQHRLPNRHRLIPPTLSPA